MNKKRAVTAVAISILILPLISSMTAADSNITLINPPQNRDTATITPELTVNVTNPDDYNMNTTFYWSNGTKIQTFTNHTNTTLTTNISGLSRDTNYEWFANITDPNATTTSQTYSFKTSKHPTIIRGNVWFEIGDENYLVGFNKNISFDNVTINGDETIFEPGYGNSDPWRFGEGENFHIETDGNQVNASFINWYDNTPTNITFEATANTGTEATFQFNSLKENHLYRIMIDGELHDWTETSGTYTDFIIKNWSTHTITLLDSLETWIYDADEEQLESSNTTNTQIALLEKREFNQSRYTTNITIPSNDYNLNKAGLIFSFEDGDNYYYSVLDVDDDQVELYRISGDTKNKINNASYTLNPSATYELVADWSDGSNLEILVDGDSQFTVDESAKKGRSGLYVNGTKAEYNSFIVDNQSFSGEADFVQSGQDKTSETVHRDIMASITLLSVGGIVIAAGFIIAVLLMRFNILNISSGGGEK